MSSLQKNENLIEYCASSIIHGDWLLTIVTLIKSRVCALIFPATVSYNDITRNGLTWSDKTSHHITSHHITSHHITLHRITSHHITSHHMTPHHITPHHTILILTSLQGTQSHPSCSFYCSVWKTIQGIPSQEQKYCYHHYKSVASFSLREYL